MARRNFGDEERVDFHCADFRDASPRGFGGAACFDTIEFVPPEA